MTLPLFSIIETDKEKRILSKDYNLYFRKSDGLSLRWGATQEDNPVYAPMPEILDCEISAGKCSNNCRFCYKSNSSKSLPKHMSLETFRKVLDKMAVGVTVYTEEPHPCQPKSGKQYFPANKLVMTDSGNILACHLYKGMLTPQGLITKVVKHTILEQIALGVTDTTSNPDFWNIIDEGRSRGLVMNLTTHGMDVTDEIAKKIAEKCGAVAVSVKKSNKETTYETIKKLSIDNNHPQINAHYVLSHETFPFAKQFIDDIKTDPRLTKLAACVFLSYKDKVNSGTFTPITIAEYKELVKYCEDKQINFGFDSCSGFTYLKTIKDRPNYKQLSECVDNCCAGRFSCYISVDAKYTPCSFTAGDLPEFGDGISVLDYNTFADIWNSPVVEQFRQYNIKCESQQKNPCRYNFT